MIQAEPLGKVRTKIVATVGPASRNPEILARLVEAGVDVFRLNFSHGSHEEHSAVLRDIRALGETTGRSIAVLQDLGGPKIRLTPIPGDQVDCRIGDQFRMVKDRADSLDPRTLACTYQNLVEDLKVGETVLFADGNVAMQVIATTSETATLEVTLAGRLRSKQGINLPGTNLRIDALTEKDRRDLDWSAREGVEYVGLSFVRSPEDVLLLRRELDARGSQARIISKIEKPQAVEQLDAIVSVSDALMVARGDLGVEMDVALVPAIQKRVIHACHQARIPVITATQMLNSMETSSRPTRAEATDVFNAVLDGTDAVMLSGETAIGEYPVHTVEMMSRIVIQAERFLAETGGLDRLDASSRTDNSKLVRPITDALIQGASTVCRSLDASLMVVATHSGRTALAVSKLRHSTPTLALADNAERARAMALYWGVTPLAVAEIADVDQALAFAIDWARGRDLVRSGDRIILVRGTIPGNPTHNAMLVQEIP